MLDQRDDRGAFHGILRFCKRHIWPLVAVALSIYMAVVIFTGIGARSAFIREASPFIIAPALRAIYKGSRRQRGQAATDASVDD
jgi:hypothetical protein